MRSQHLDEVIYFASDNAELPPGVDRGRVYFCNELLRIIERQPEPWELRLIHATKRTFAGRVVQ